MPHNGISSGKYSNGTGVLQVDSLVILKQYWGWVVFSVPRDTLIEGLRYFENYELFNLILDLKIDILASSTQIYKKISS